MLSTTAREFLAMKTRSDLANFLGVPLQVLTKLLYGLHESKRYFQYDIPKRTSGGLRTISAPIAPLKTLQRELLPVLNELYNPRNCVHGYVHNRSFKSNAENHVGRRWLLRIDLKDFFPSITFPRIYGLFKSAPFTFSNEVAAALGKLCTYWDILPQGAPTSPILSNMICFKLDRMLMSIASAHECTYTRYCDDMIFSGKHGPQSIPTAIVDVMGSSEVYGIHEKPVIGHEVEMAIKQNHFTINSAKTRIAHRNQRQMATGLVVNNKVNVKRSYVRSIRNVLHVWREYDEESALNSLLEYRKRYIPPGKDTPDLASILRGQIQFVGNVKGWHDQVYRKLAFALKEQYPAFIPSTKYLTEWNLTLNVFVEGITGCQHLRHALDHFHSQGEYKDLNLVIPEDLNLPDSEMREMCKTRCRAAPNSHTALFIFDSDDPSMTNKVTDANGGMKAWGNNTFSMTIPTPPFREDRGICIELLYPDSILFQENAETGRRIFLLDEFEEDQHRTKKNLRRKRNKKGKLNSNLVVEDVFLDKVPVSSSKSEFADSIQREEFPTCTEDLVGFQLLLEEIRKIKHHLVYSPSNSRQKQIF